MSERHSREAGRLSWHANNLIADGSEEKRLMGRKVSADPAVPSERQKGQNGQEKKKFHI